VGAEFLGAIVAGSKTRYLERAHLDGTLGGPNYVRPTTVYIGLFSAMANPELGQVTEMVETGYVRQAVTNDATHWPAASSVTGQSIKTNGTIIAFAYAQADWPAIVGVGVYDGPLSGDNLLYWADASKVILNGNRAMFGVGAITLVED
jgi:hypothetical protein